jgi:hypothetical protein
VLHATFTPADLTAFGRLDALGLEAVGQRLGTAMFSWIEACTTLLQALPTGPPVTGRLRENRPDDSHPGCPKASIKLPDKPADNHPDYCSRHSSFWGQPNFAYAPRCPFFHKHMHGLMHQQSRSGVGVPALGLMSDPGRAQIVRAHGPTDEGGGRCG